VNNNNNSKKVQKTQRLLLLDNSRIIRMTMNMVRRSSWQVNQLRARDSIQIFNKKKK
jgi:hypothetical protein